MDKLSDDIIIYILNKIQVETKIKYIPFNDGEQNRTIFYMDDNKFKCCKLFNNFFNKKKKLKSFFNLF